MKNVPIKTLSKIIKFQIQQKFTIDKFNNFIFFISIIFCILYIFLSGHHSSLVDGYAGSW